MPVRLSRSLGDCLEDAAQAVGVSSRTVREWRGRAWSRAAADEPYVAVERAIQQAQLVAAYRRGEAAVGSWQAAALWLEREDPCGLTG